MIFKIAEKYKMVIEKMVRDGELENSLNGVVNPPPCFDHRKDDNLVSSSSYKRGSLTSEYSHLNAFSNGFNISMDCSPCSAPFEETKYQTPSTDNLNGLWLDFNPSYSRVSKELVNDLGLPESFYRMDIRDKQEERTKMRGLDRNPNGFGLGDGSLGGAISWNFESPGPYGDFRNDLTDCENFRSTMGVVPVSFDGDMRSTLLGLRQGYNMGDPTGSPVTHIHPTAMDSNPGFNNNQMSHSLGDKQDQEDGGWYCRDFQLQNPISSSPYYSDEFVCSLLHGPDSNGGKGLRDSFSSPQLLQAKRLVNSPLHIASMMNERTKANPRSEATSFLKYKERAGDIEGYSCEDSFIIEGKCISALIKERNSLIHKKNSHNGMAIRNARDKSHSLGCYSPNGEIYGNGWNLGGDSQFRSLPTIGSLVELQGYMYLLAKDQYGCRILQRVFDEGTSQDVQLIFNEIIGHVMELSTNPFGNYLVQKLLEVCSEEQKLQIVLVVTQEAGQLVKISLNQHGTRVVQKLIETVKSRKQISLVMSALEPGFLDLIKDLNGNHVVQRCLSCLGNEDNKFIFDAAAKFCVDIATHRHGCCVLQRCISYSTGKYQLKLVTEISKNGLLLAQDPFGNYVVQFIIEQKIPPASAKLTSLFKGHYVHLSMQKFSSHVVEKCLKHLPETRPRIVQELLLVSHFEWLLQDPYANYVIRSALIVTKGTALHDNLVRAVRPHTTLRSSPYCKKIFSQAILKK